MQRRGIDKLHRATVLRLGVEVGGDGGGARRCVNGCHLGIHRGVGAVGLLVVEGYLLVRRPRHVQDFLVVAVLACSDGAGLCAIATLGCQRGRELYGLAVAHGGYRVVDGRVVIATGRRQQCARCQEQGRCHDAVCTFLHHCRSVFWGLVTLFASSEGVVVRRVVGASPSEVAACQQVRVLLQLDDPHRGPLVLSFLFCIHTLIGFDGCCSVERMVLLREGSKKHIGFPCTNARKAVYLRASARILTMYCTPVALIVCVCVCVCVCVYRNI